MTMRCSRFFICRFCFLVTYYKKCNSLKINKNRLRFEDFLFKN